MANICLAEKKETNLSILNKYAIELTAECSFRVEKLDTALTKCKQNRKTKQNKSICLNTHGTDDFKNSKSIRNSIRRERDQINWSCKSEMR